MENHSSIVPLKKKRKAKPMFAKMLAWFGVFWNAVYLVYTIYNLFLNYPKNIIEYIIVAIITITFGIIYLKMISKFNVKAYKISTILALIWLVILVIKFIIMKTKDESIETLFVLGAVYTLVVNVIALRQVKKFHNV
jgi:4-amino-4-deoxy-L-arabinose transferase-like glycosyltransferase